jgi:hypothetical protein
MAYVINRTNGQQLLILADGTLDTSTSLFLIGKNYPGYGELQQENFIRLLESGANNTAPVAPLAGQLWYDTSTSKLKIFDGSAFKSIGSAVSATAPVGAIAGDSWWDTTNDQLKVYDGVAWQLVGPAYSKLDGRTGSLVETLYDGTGTKHLVITDFVANVRTAITSQDSEFTPNVAVPGYPTIKPGYNYNNGAGTQFSISRSTSGSILVTNGANNANITLQANISGTITSVLNINASTGLITVADQPTNDLGIATKRYVDLSSSGVDTKLATNVATINASIATLTANAATQHNTLLSLDNLKAPIASPTLTGTPLSTTPSTADDSTRIATTAFVKSAIAEADNGLWKGSNKFVSTTTPTAGDGADGDIWFVI